MRKFYIISLFSLLAALASCSRTSEQSVTQDRTAQVNVIPQPHHLQMAEGAFRIDRDTKIFIDVQSDEMLRIAGFLNERLSSAAGFSLEISGTMPESDAIYFMNAGLPAESYGMNVTPDRIVRSIHCRSCRNSRILISNTPGIGTKYIAYTNSTPPTSLFHTCIRLWPAPSVKPDINGLRCGLSLYRKRVR